MKTYQTTPSAKPIFVTPLFSIGNPYVTYTALLSCLLLRTIKITVISKTAPPHATTSAMIPVVDKPDRPTVGFVRGNAKIKYITMLLVLSYDISSIYSCVCTREY